MNTKSDLANGLLPTELSSFLERGFSRTFAHPLLATPGRAETLIDAFRRIEGLAYPGPTHLDMEKRLDSGAPWFQSTFTLAPDIWAIGSHPAIVDRVKSILGPDVIMWGSSLLTKKPGDIHCWHTDTVNWDSVGVFVGLQGTSRNSNLQLITRMHRSGVSPYDLFTDGAFTDVRANADTPLADSARVLEAARKLNPSCELVQEDIRDGEFFLFDGLAWHGSENKNPTTRVAVTFFFARPDADIQIPTAFGAKPCWYGKKPPCSLVAGIDRYRKNHIVQPFASG